MTEDPLSRFHRWYKQAERAQVPLVESMALATADRTGKPSVRYVLLKQADERGFVFFTNARSRKGQELHVNPRASGAFYWDAVGKQVRFEGHIEELSVAEVDEYWSTRPRASQLGAVASEQGAPLTSRSALIARWKAARKRYLRRSIPRPASWTGFRLVPDRIEFWTRRRARLHDRELFVRTPTGWKRELLQP